MESSSKQPALATGRRSAARGRGERSTSPAELREYLNSLNEKDIDQLMGPVSQGSLMQGILLATAATIVLLLACTIIPYALNARSALGIVRFRGQTLWPRPRPRQPPTWRRRRLRKPVHRWKPA